MGSREGCLKPQGVVSPEGTTLGVTRLCRERFPNLPALGQRSRPTCLTPWRARAFNLGDPVAQLAEAVLVELPVVRQGGTPPPESSAFPRQLATVEGRRPEPPEGAPGTRPGRLSCPSGAVARLCRGSCRPRVADAYSARESLSGPGLPTQHTPTRRRPAHILRQTRRKFLCMALYSRERRADESCHWVFSGRAPWVDRG